MVHTIVVSNGFEHLEKLLQKSLRYKHHLLNHKETLRRVVIPKSLRIRKDPALEPVGDDFAIKWNKILYNAEKNMVELLLFGSSNVEECGKNCLNLEEIKRNLSSAETSNFCKGRNIPPDICANTVFFSAQDIEEL